MNTNFYYYESIASQPASKAETPRHNVGDAPAPSWPPNPAVPPTGLYDWADDANWPPLGPDGYYEAYTNDPNHPGYMDELISVLGYLHNNSNSTGALLIFNKMIAKLSFLKQPDGSSVLSSADIQKLDQLFPNPTTSDSSGVEGLIQDAIFQGAQFAFLNGYDGKTGGDAYLAYLTDIKNASGNLPSNEYTNFMEATANLLINNESNPKDSFIQNHIAGEGTTPMPKYDTAGNLVNAGDIIWLYKDPITGITECFDWTNASNDWNGAKKNPEEDQAVMNTITGIISNSSIAGSQASSPNSDMDYLDKAISKLQAMNFLAIFDNALKMSGGDVGLAIMLAMYEMSGDKLSDLGGNANVMDQQHELSEQAKEIEDYLQGLATATPADIGNLRALTTSLFTEISTSTALSSLSPAVERAISTLNSTTINYIYQGEPYHASVWQLLNGQDSTGRALDNTEIASALQQGLTPTWDPSKTPPDSSVSAALQGVLGGFDSIITAISSASTQETTIASQLQSLIEAITKVMTGVIDPNTGMNTAVIKQTISHQTGN